MWAIYLVWSSFGKKSASPGWSWASERGVIVATVFLSLTIQVSTKCQQVSAHTFVCRQVSASVSKCQQVSACVSEVSAKLDFVFAKNKTFRQTRMYLRWNRFVVRACMPNKPLGELLLELILPKAFWRNCKTQRFFGHACTLSPELFWRKYSLKFCSTGLLQKDPCAFV